MSKRDGSDDDDSVVTDRRGFFRFGGRRTKEGSARALRAIGEAFRGFQDALDGLDEESGARTRLHGELSATGSEAPEPPAQPPRRRVIRPPGAREEPDFLRHCATCHSCVAACPFDAIVVATDPVLAGRIGTPELRVRYTPCELCDDVPCASACPTGALRPIPASAIRIGLARVTHPACLNALGESCDICVDMCPVPGALRRAASGFPVVDAALCTGCGQCVQHCPTSPAAIMVIPS